MRRIHIPTLDLELAGVDADTAHRVLDRLPASLSRALAGGAHGTGAAATDAVGALADRVARQVAARVRARTSGSGGEG